MISRIRRETSFHSPIGFPSMKRFIATAALLFTTLAGAEEPKGGLVFLGGTPYLYAFDKATGTEVWRGATPFQTHANPMTYRAQSGQQFVVIATGTGPDAALVAFARPK
ncbi:MAG: PQQ-binding-like beta-propeller repeat protein [Gemmatimonadetes bacterium]|nr:PQQ-binding-like beta-propeller repeat protein [Gemmatimonadota bacterium]